MKKVYRHLKSDNGNTMIEATFVVTIAIVVVTVIMMLGMVFYQESLLQSAANLTATQIARTYSFKQKDPVTGYIDEGALKKQGFLEGAYFILDNATGRKGQGVSLGKTLAKKNADKGRMLASHEVKAPVVVIRNSDVAKFQKEVTVTIEESYNIPFVKLLGVDDGKLTRKYTGKALCVDVLGAKSYHNVFAVVTKNLASEGSVETIKNVVKLVTNVIDSAGNLNTFIQKQFMEVTGG